MRSLGPVESLTQCQTTHAVCAFLDVLFLVISAAADPPTVRLLSVNVQSLRDRFLPRPAEHAWTATVQLRGELLDRLTCPSFSLDTRWNGHRTLQIRGLAVGLEARALTLKSCTKSLRALIPLAPLFSLLPMRSPRPGRSNSHPWGRARSARTAG
jgi:hypothetical protein